MRRTVSYLSLLLVSKSKNAYIDEVVQQSVKKKVLPAIERRIRTELTEKAEERAIQLFSTTCAISSWLLH